MSQIDLYFDGYCPECLLKGEQVEMRLNSDDFWECEKSHLQIAVFPPFATVLEWRGSGNLKPSSSAASDQVTGMVMTRGRDEDGKEFLPNEDAIIRAKDDLEWYLDELYDSKKAFIDSKFDPDDPIFMEQDRWLKTIPKEDYQELFRLYDKIGSAAPEFLHQNEDFQQFHRLLYDLKLVFNFNWMSWKKGFADLNSYTAFTRCSPLQLSMYLTLIFRSDRFDDGAIRRNIENGNLEKIMRRFHSVVGSE